MKITVVGAGFYGSTLTQRIAEAGYADEVVMTDIIEDKPQGLALDMMQSRPIEGFETRITGSNSYDATAGSDVCVITAGLPRKPGMSRMDLLEVNAKIVGDVTRQLVAGSPDAVIIVVSNPLDEMTALCAQVSGLPRSRVIGQAGMLDTARFKHFVAERLDTSPSKIEAMTLGSHGDTMVPVPSQVKVDGRPLMEMLDEAGIEEIVQRTRDGGAEIVAFLKTGSAYYAPSSAVTQMVEAIAHDKKRILPCAAWVQGEYGVARIHLGVPCKLGRRGLEQVLEVKLSDAEQAALKKSADAVKETMAAVSLKP